MTPQELQNLIAQQYGNVITAGSALTANAAPIPTANVAGIDALMGQAGNVASNISSGAQGYFGNAANYMANVSGSMANASQMANTSTAAYDPQSYQSYMDPYQQEVIDKYAQEMQRQFGISQQNRAAQAVGAGAFGGGREGVYQAEGLRSFQEQLGTGIAGLLSKGYGQAQTMAQQNFADQMKRLQGASGLELAGGELGLGTGTAFGDLGSQFGSTMANTATTLGNIGVTGTQFQQDIYDKQYQNQMAQYLQPYQQLQFQAGLLAGAAPSFMNNPASPQGNPLLAGIGTLTGYLS
jgi:hypothetical protein